MTAHQLARLPRAIFYASTRAVSGPRYAHTIASELRQAVSLTLSAELQPRNLNVVGVTLDKGNRVACGVVPFTGRAAHAR